MGGSVRVNWVLEAGDALGLVDDEGNRNLYPGEHRLTVTRGHGEVIEYPIIVKISEPIVIETLF